MLLLISTSSLSSILILQLRFPLHSSQSSTYMFYNAFMSTSHIHCQTSTMPLQSPCLHFPLGTRHVMASLLTAQPGWWGHWAACSEWSAWLLLSCPERNAVPRLHTLLRCSTQHGPLLELWQKYSHSVQAFPVRSFSWNKPFRNWGVEMAIKDNLFVIGLKWTAHAERSLHHPRLKNPYEQQRVQS